MKLKHIAFCLAALLPATGAGVAQAQEEIIFGLSAATGSLQQQTASEFARRVNEKLDGKAVVKVFDSSQLGKDKDMLQKIKLGTMHLTLPSSTMPDIASEYAIFDLPFLVADREHLTKIDETLFKDVLVPAAMEQGYRPLAIWENGFRQITNNERPINTPEDLKGLKIRTPNSSWRVAMFKEYGSNPTPMGFSEVFVALQTGVIDGQENPLTNIAAGKLDEVQEYLSLSGHVYSPAYPTVGVAAFEKLDPEVQTVLAETAQEVAIWAREMGASKDGDLLKQLEENGMKVNKADRAAFVAASKPLYDKFAAEVENGQAMIDQALSLADGS
ncbi:TRAP transporter substrate-binding protein [Nitratireductor aquimarinus]|uniref:TRAP transporter substrate-binding protein n=1 Tax=Nitratireductor aquimarinus TaxID=889300 RepID=A0ABU4AMT6_9HYPH|nr:MULTISPECIES: TRAP transporter substrate-binding protein [Alphaproteobacteria]MBY6023041.1 TRAP transporter substrate-binding protein [Nitratireductor sp. DP7N14-4]MBN7758248.1 TRAP transporter substrate-binding protein [Nitratireductor aquimarinus]MBN7760932.1 TRAP transporter substrate-binding protein [Nitratireductor aquibiodomus]MBN7776154.1 TRAP transporter substrate-binding protein [Nitratireductor pacificus]MBN7779021.1 TRAP transporter substrate-binding protein [Nitratireductor paci